LDAYVLYTLRLYAEGMGQDKGDRYRSELVSFIVRCWPHASSGGTIWRGEVEHVQSGRREAFQELGRIVKVMEDLLGSIADKERGGGRNAK
jgi:hypothetical protein